MTRTNAPLLASAPLVAGDPRELALRALGRVTAVEPMLHALVAERGRRKRVLAAADATPDGLPLRGAPVGVKDIFHVDGLPTRAGSSVPARALSGAQGGCVRALEAAGALVLAKTVTAEFAFLEPGPTCNPHDPERTPGGSSSGSAAGVAAGYFPLAIGTQTIGSVIRPAAFCGVVGFKPTYGRIPADGLVSCAPSADTVGLFTQTVAGASLAASVVCAAWRGDGDAGPIVLGIPDGPYLEHASREGLDAFREQLARTGMQARSVPILEDFDEVAERHRRLVLGEMARTHEVLFRRYADRYRPGTAAAIVMGQDIAESDIGDARAGGHALAKQIADAMDAAGVSVIVCPAAPGPAPGIETTGNSIMNLPWTHAGVPAITVPAGYSAGRTRGLPLGVQCVAPRGADEQLLAQAAMIEAALTDGGTTNR